MHYANGREAKQGDFVVGKSGNVPVAGVIHSLQAGSTTCNAQLVPVQYPHSTSVTLSDLLHVDDLPKSPK